jgi:hypothetical protein
MGRKDSRIRVEADTQQRLIGCHGLRQLVVEGKRHERVIS